MNLIRNSFWTPLMALDRLNSWLRVTRPYYCPARSALKHVIYTTKIAAILATSKQQQIVLRRVMVKKECRSCGGNGIYHGWWSNGPEDGELCRTCSATGNVKLKFIESIIGPIRWHTPAHKWYSWSLDVRLPYPSYAYESGADAMFETTDWEPCTPGRPLSLADARRDMLLILEAWPHDSRTCLTCGQTCRF